MKVQLFVRINSIENAYFFESLLYNTYRHIAASNHADLYTYLLTLEGAQKAYAFIHFITDGNNAWTSLPQTPFGGVQQSGHLTERQFSFLFSCIIDDSGHRGCRRWLVLPPPSFYQPDYTVMHTHALKNAGFKDLRTDKYHAIKIDDHTFERHLAPAEKRRLRKSRKAGMSAARIEHFDAGRIYTQIEQWHNSVGYRLSLSEDKFCALISACPSDVLVFQVSFAERPVALGVLISVDQNVLYHFLPAWDKDFRTYSPTVLLTEAIYNYAQAQGFRWLDLGRSLGNDQKEKPGLTRFKERLGAVEFRRTVWLKDS